LSYSRQDSQGKRLFRHARSCLSVDKFEKFLDNVRKLNARAITIEEALLEAEKICGEGLIILVYFLTGLFLFF
jgi:hypothetical protein